MILVKVIVLIKIKDILFLENHINITIYNKILVKNKYLTMIKF